MSNERTTSSRFSDDQPIRGRGQDRLGRTPFSEALAGAIRDWTGRESLVIALFGRWGTGKSSIKNMVLESLRESAPNVRIAQFNPWRFANRDQITQTFFDQVGIALGRGARKTAFGRAKLAARWKRYAAYLKTGSDLVSAIQTPIAASVFLLGGIVISTGYFGNYSLATVVGAVLVAASGILHWSTRAAEWVQSIFAVGVDVGQKSLEELRDDLAKELRTLEAPLLVVIDDLDRLTPDETVEMLQLIKANADFPNVVYLLLCDRETVEGCIERALSSPGRAYLEKIVQVAFDIPAVEATRLRKVLFSGLDELLQDKEVSRRFDQVRWGNVFHGGLGSYFTTLREVNRYLSTLSFHLSVFRTKSAFEVNPIDLITIEMFRLFESSVYREVEKNKDALTGRRERDEDDARRATLDGIVGAAPPDRRPQVKALLIQLFPSAEWAWGGTNYASGFEDNWFRELRVCSPELFDRYFAFTIPEGDLSETELSSLLGLTSDRKALRAQLRKLAKQSLLGVALDRLEAYKQKIDRAHGRAFVTALFDVSEDIPDDGRGMFEMSSQMHASRIVYWYLIQDGFTNAERAAILRDAVRDTKGLALPVAVVSLEDQGQREGRDRRMVDSADIDPLKTLCVQKIAEAATDGRLVASTDFVSLLYRWQQWGGEETVRDYCTKLVSTPTGALSFLQKFVGQSRGQSMGDYVSRVRWSVRLSNVEAFVSIDELKASLSKLPNADRAEAEQRALTAFEKSLKRKAEGKAEDSPFWDDDD